MTKFTFDFIDAVQFAYTRVWAERSYLLRLAAIPIFLKFAMAVIFYALNYDDPFLRRGLVMLPATFAEGWLLAQFLRTLLLEERWPMAVPSRESLTREAIERNDPEITRLIERARGIISATLIFVLTTLVSTVIGWALVSLDASTRQNLEALETASSGAKDAGGSLLLFPAIGLFVLFIWAFRLMWLNIPYAVLMPTRDYLKGLGGLMSSMRMLGLYLICILPVSVLASVATEALVGGFGDDPDAVPAILRFISIFIAALLDIVTSLIAVAGLTYALRSIIPHARGALNDNVKG